MSDSAFSQRLLHWFAQHGRKDLPWQQNPGAYRIWVSEIMLQQTQVNTVIPYFQAFIQAFPDLENLAKAPLDRVLQHWTGLGYYARARNLHLSAQRIMQDFHGEMPHDLNTLQTLPGVGRSTAAAILALAYGQSQAILDGNVKRVLCRYQAIGGYPNEASVNRQLWALAQALTPAARVAEYTQAIMDLGATLCTRARPQCARCPQQGDCQAHQQGRESDYPSPRPRKVLPVKCSYLLMLQNPEAQVLLQRRPARGIWGGLWSFPECSSETGIYEWCWAHLQIQVQNYEVWQAFRHTFTHYHLDIVPVWVQIAQGVREKDKMPPNSLWVEPDKPPGGLPAPVVRLLNALPKNNYVHEI